MAQAVNFGQLIRDAARRDDGSDLPARTREAIGHYDRVSEILVKLIQLVVVAIWTGLYLVSPRAMTATSSLVPYALAAYFAGNLAGLIWAWQRALPNWAVYLSSALDVAVLMLLIWSFHVQYGQPAAFYLKSPALLYVFVFIALRALRFQARFVLATGLFAVVGWGTLAAYAILVDEGGGITRDYIKYLTSNTILIGAEFDKIVVILMVTAIIAMALKRANGFLVQATAEGANARDLSRFFDETVASRIKYAEDAVAAGQGLRRQAAILYIDIRGFTALAAKLDPAAVMELLTAYQGKLVPLIREHGGSIDKFLGDGILATFGAVEPSPSHAADALRALDAIVAETAGWRDGEGVLASLRRGAVNGAVASGEVVFGVLGGEGRLEYTVIGDAVNLAAKLEKLNRPSGSRALTDAATLRAAIAQGYRLRETPRRLATPLGQAVVLAEQFPGG